MKTCSKCGEQKELVDFPNDKRVKSGKRADCKACQAAHARAQFKADPEKFRKWRAAWRERNPGREMEVRRLDYEKNRERKRATSLAWHRNNPEKSKLRARKVVLDRYGLTFEKYEEMLACQGGVCWICGGKNGAGKNLSIDHCHATGRVRKLLCSLCNAALERVEHVPHWGAKAEAYLLEFQDAEAS